VQSASWQQPEYCCRSGSALLLAHFLNCSLEPSADLTLLEWYLGIVGGCAEGCKKCISRNGRGVACRHTPPRVPVPLTRCESITDMAVVASLPPPPPMFLCCPVQSPAFLPGCTSVSAMKTEPSLGSWWPARCLSDSSSQQQRVPPARQQWPQRKALQQAGGCWHELLPVNQLGWCQDVSSGQGKEPLMMGFYHQAV
jgi:hypothetical protein